MLRHLLESVTGTVTGSDSRPDRAMARDLQLYGLAGEGRVGQHAGGGRVWVVKSHFPEKVGWKAFGSQRAILLVRNPFNVLRSYFNMLLTGTHTHSIAPSEYTVSACPLLKKHGRALVGWRRGACGADGGGGCSASRTSGIATCARRSATGASSTATGCGSPSPSSWCATRSS
jgi:hypothetical protein